MSAAPQTGSVPPSSTTAVRWLCPPEKEAKERRKRGRREARERGERERRERGGREAGERQERGRREAGERQKRGERERETGERRESGEREVRERHHTIMSYNNTSKKSVPSKKAQDFMPRFYIILKFV